MNNESWEKAQRILINLMLHDPGNIIHIIDAELLTKQLFIVIYTREKDKNVFFAFVDVLTCNVILSDKYP